jgi:Ca2+/Na+ antiporter
MVVIGIVALLARLRTGLEKTVRRALMRAASMFITMGLFGLFLWGVLYERVPYLSMRAWYLLWLFLLGFWIYRIYHFVFVEVPARQKVSEEREAINKWLPKSKK